MDRTAGDEMTVVNSSYNSKVFLTTLLVLVLSGTACVAPAWSVTPTVVATPRTVLPTPTTVVTTPQKAVTTVRVTAAQSLHIRQHPSDRSKVLGYFYNSDQVTLTGACSAGWAQIVWKSGVAWVNSDYLSDNKCK